MRKFEALELFEQYKRPTSTSIQEFLVEFDKSYGTTMSTDMLGYRLLKSANLTVQNEQLIKATTELTYQSIKDPLKKIFVFGDENSLAMSQDDLYASNIKT